MTARHGYGPYSRGRCRCEICTQAATEYRRRHRARMRENLAARPHGKRSTYDAGCRCASCRAARQAAYRRDREAAAAAS